MYLLFGIQLSEKALVTAEKKEGKDRVMWLPLGGNSKYIMGP